MLIGVKTTPASRKFESGHQDDNVWLVVYAACNQLLVRVPEVRLQYQGLIEVYQSGVSEGSTEGNDPLYSLRPPPSDFRYCNRYR